MTDDDPPASNDDPADDLPAEQPTVDAGSKRSYRTQKERAKRDHDEAQEFWRGVFADPIGRRELWRILASAHVFEERFACGPNGFPQPEATWFHAGEQAFGLRLYQSWARLDRAGVFLMHDEHDARFAVPVVPRTKKAV